MNYFADLEALPGVTPTCALIKALDLASLTQGAQLLTQAQREADAILAGAHDAAQAIETEMHARCAEEYNAWRATVHDEVVRTTVSWLVEAESLQNTVLSHMETRIRTAMAQALQAWVAEHDSGEALLAQILPQVQRYAQHGNLTLRVPPAQLAQMVAQSPAVLNCVADDRLSLGQAVLESPLLRLELDLARHAQQMCDQLGGTAQEAEHE